LRIAIDIDSTLHHHWPQVAAAAARRYGIALPYEEQYPATARRLTEEQLRTCIADTHTDAAIAAAVPYPGAVATVARWHAGGHAIHVVSDRPARSAAATRRWLARNGLPCDALHCGADKLAYCRRAAIGLLIDDLPGNLLGALTAGLRAATLRHPWNAHLCAGSGIVCAPDWTALARALDPLLAATHSGPGSPVS
jgi:uncharacterized protein